MFASLIGKGYEKADKMIEEIQRKSEAISNPITC